MVHAAWMHGRIRTCVRIPNETKGIIRGDILGGVREGVGLVVRGYGGGRGSREGLSTMNETRSYFHFD